MEYYSLKEDELIGKQFGDLTVLDLAYVNEKLNLKKYLCECKCGQNIVVYENDLVIGHINNCGCDRKKEYIKISCNHCGKIMKFPLEKKNFKKEVIEDYCDNKGKQHYKVIYDVNCPSYEVIMLKKFIENNCIVLGYMPARNRTSKKTFKEAYIKWLQDNCCLSLKLNNKELNKQLKEIYDETCIKSNGNVYMSKIKLIEKGEGENDILT